MNNQANVFGIRGDETDQQGEPLWDYFRHEVVDYSDKLLYGANGPWPMPSPGRPLSEVAEVVNMPRAEMWDWYKNVALRYLKLIVTKTPEALYWAYFKSGSRYRNYTDTAFQNLLNRRMYSKFFTPLDHGDKNLFAGEIAAEKLDPTTLLKMDFSGMEKMCNHCHEGVYTAASIVLFTPDGRYDDGSAKFRAVAIHLYTTDAQGKKDQASARTYTPNSKAPDQQKKWRLAKYFVLQGAVHRINMTEHGRLHFPLDAMNAITKSILPTDHPLFVILKPHLRLTLAVDNSVLEGKNALISRTNWTIYSPFAAPGKIIRKLIPDGYVGRRDKPNAFPPYEFPFRVNDTPTSFNLFLSSYLPLFEKFYGEVLDILLPDSYRVDENASDADKQARRCWEFIALWAECTAEWVPGFLRRKALNLTPLNGLVTPDKAPLIATVANIIWNVTIAHAADHVEFGNNGPARNVFRIRVKPPLGDTPVDYNFRKKMVNRFDLFQSYLAHELFYKPLNTVNLEDVRYPFNEIGVDAETQRILEMKHGAFLKALQECDTQQMERDPLLCALEDVSSSIQY